MRSHSRPQKIAYRLARITQATQNLQHRKTPIQPFPPGPATLKRLTAGMLIMEAVRQITANSVSRDFLAAEFTRRGLHECASLVRDGKPNEMLDSDIVDPILDVATDQIKSVETDAIFDNVAALLDESDPEFDQHMHKTMLSPAEQIADLIAIGAPQRTIQAFIEAQGVSTVSASTYMAVDISRDVTLGQDLELLVDQDQSYDASPSL